MSTLQITGHPRRLRTRLAAGLLALIAAIAIAAAILITSLTGNGSMTTAAAPTSATTLRTIHDAPHLPGWFRDPTTHALIRVPSTPTKPTKAGGEHRGRILP